MAIALRKALSPARLVALAWACGVASLLLGLANGVVLVREHWLAIAVLIWLAPLAAYDLHFREVPHMACVAIPCVVAVVYSFVTRAWLVGILALIAITASERRALRNARFERLVFGGASVLGTVLALSSGESVPGAFAVLGFWLAYEAGWWAGADALAAMTLALVDQRVHFLLTMCVAHGAVLLVTQVVRLHRLWRVRKAGASEPQDTESGLSRLTAVPGLPVIALAAVLLFIWDAATTIALPWLL